MKKFIVVALLVALLFMSEVSAFRLLQRERRGREHTNNQSDDKYDPIIRVNPCANTPQGFCTRDDTYTHQVRVPIRTSKRNKP